MRARRELTAAEYDAWCATSPRWKRAAVAARLVWLGIDMARPRCDCPGCVPRVRYTRTLTVRLGGLSGARIDKAIDAFTIARAIRFAGLNTPDRKQMGSAQTLACQP